MSVCLLLRKCQQINFWEIPLFGNVRTENILNKMKSPSSPFGFIIPNPYKSSNPVWHIPEVSYVCGGTLFPI